jgi:hypothetical protein
LGNNRETLLISLEIVSCIFFRQYVVLLRSGQAINIQIGGNENEKKD